MKKKLGFSLSGGGARGIAHAGFLQAMEENGIKPDVISGCSMGAVVGGCYAAGVSVKTLKNALIKLTQKDLLDFNLNLLKSRSVFSGKKMETLLRKYLGNKEIESLTPAFGCIAADLITGKTVDITDGDLVSSITASAAIPMIFKPVERNGKLLIDGGTILRNPLKLCKTLGADVIIGVDVIGKLPEVERLDGLLDIGMRTFSVIDGLFCGKIGLKYANLMVYPQMKNVSLFKFDNLKDAYESGYKAGLDSVEKIKALIK